MSAFDLGFVPIFCQLPELVARLLGGAGLELSLDLALLLQQRVFAGVDQRALGTRGLARLREFHIRVAAQGHPPITPAKAVAQRPARAQSGLLAQVQPGAIGE